MDALSQKDIDSMLRGAAPPVAPKPSTEVLPYNFRRPPRISRERQATLEAIHSRFAITMQSLLSSRLRHPVDVVVASVEQATFGEFTMALGTPCAAYIYDLGERIGVQAVFDLDPDLAMHIVDRLFGGPGQSNGARRALTALEQNVLENLTGRAMGLLRDAWGEFLPLEPKLASFESIPETLQIAGREDNVLVINLDVRSGGTSGLMTVCLPLMALEHFLQEKAGPLLHVARVRAEDRATARVNVEHHVRSAALPVVVRLPELTLTAFDVATLREGQVLQTGLPLGGEVDVIVNGRRLFTGTLGRSQGAVGVRLAREVSPDAPVRPIRRGQLA